MALKLARLDDAPNIVQALQAAPVVAVDTEFHAERRWMPALYLVQLHLPDGDTWIVDPLEEGLLASLAPALTSTSWIVHGGHWDMEVLQQALGSLPERILDTQIAAGLVSPQFPERYGNLVSRYVGKELEKSATMSDWSRRPLTHRQMAYAAEDVELLPPLWARLEALLRELDRYEVCVAACNEARATVVDPPEPHDAWRRLGAHRSLTPQQLAVLQELASWRATMARQANQPERGSFSDGAMVDLAKRQPLTRESLAANRRTPRWVMKHADEVLERIARASQRPPSAWPRSAGRRSPAARQLAWLQVWAEAMASERSFGSGLVLPSARLEDALLADDEDGKATALGAWRHAFIGAELQTALAGGVQLRLMEGDLVTSPFPGEPGS